MGNLGLPDPLGIFGEPTDLLGRKEKKPKGADPNAALLDALTQQSKPVMPTPNDEEAKKRRRRSYAEQRARSGRASTIFTEGQGLGG